MTDSKTYTVKFRVGKYRYPVVITMIGEKLKITFRYVPELVEEVKNMSGARWNPDYKFWTVDNNARNLFTIAFLSEKDPYAPYNGPLVDFKPRRKMPDGSDYFMSQQFVMSAHGMTRRQCIFACEMGTGKTLAAIEVMEQSGHSDWYWIGPKSALYSVKLEFSIWKICDVCGLPERAIKLDDGRIIPAHKNDNHPWLQTRCIHPKFFTYEGLRKLVDDWPSDKKPPKGLILDESSRCKNPTAQRSQAAQNLADAMRREWGRDAWVIEMSGTPAPKSPLDWWSQCEIACPGFVKEGTYQKFQKRLAVIEERESPHGGVYPHLVCWRDSDKRCVKCGELDSSPRHDLAAGGHTFEACVNEVAKMYKRMSGLVLVQFKKDCFSADTEVLTYDGVFTFGELVKIGRAKLYVSTPNGMQWINSTIKSFGIQETYPVTFGDGSVVRTTRGHKWLVRYDPRQNKNGFKIKRTDELKCGKDQLPLACQELPEVNWEAYAHGFVYGDGAIATSQATGRQTSRVPLYGHDVDLKPILLKHGTLGSMKRGGGWDYYQDVINSLPKAWKNLPVNPDKSYALGFVLGLVAADGMIRDTEVVITQADKWALDKVRKLAIWCGLRCAPIYLASEESPFDGSYKPAYRFSIQTYNMSEEHFVREDHKETFKKRGRFLSTTVTHMDFYKDKREEEVFCAIVPDFHNFTLANNVITENCMDLPDKRYKIIQLQPSSELLRAAQLINARAPSAIQALTLLRELSDGFQYREHEVGTQTCPMCKGGRTRKHVVDANNPDLPLDALSIQMGKRVVYDEAGVPTVTDQDLKLEERDVACDACDGLGEIAKLARTTVEVKSPKEDALKDLIDEHDEIGRVVIYGGFTGTIDKCVALVKRLAWDYIRVDGRGWETSLRGKNPVQMLEAFQRDTKIERLAFIGQPGAAGMGLNLTASPSVIYYSNDFNAESRIQSEDRIHRKGMDKNLGATIYDLLLLPSDMMVLNNLKRKRRLQDLSLGEMRDEIAAIKFSDIRVL